MTIQATPPFCYPMDIRYTGNTPSIGSGGDMLIDATAEKAAFVFIVPKSGTVTDITFYVRFVTTGDTLLGGIYTVDASGQPTSTGYGSMVGGTLSVTTSGQKTITLATPATMTKGDIVAVVISFNAFVAGNIAIGGMIDSTSITLDNRFPYATHFTGSWAQKRDRMPLMGIKYNDGTYGFTGWSMPVNSTAFGSYSIGTGTTPDEIGVTFTVPVGMRLFGVRVQVRAGAASNLRVKVYNSADALQTSVDLPYDLGKGMHEIFFPATVSLTANSTYRVTILALTVNTITLDNIQFVEAAALAGGPFGTAYYKTHRKSAGAWTDTTTEVPMMYLIMDGVDAGSSGGMLVHPGMSGGIRA